MRILLDTHIFLWFISGDAQLSKDVRDSIREPDNEVYLSAVSVWETVRLIRILCKRSKIPVTKETVLCQEPRKPPTAQMNC